MNVVLLLIIRVPSYQTLYHRMLWLSAVVAMACGGCCDRMRWLLWQNNTIVVAMPDTMLYMFAMTKFLHETGCCIVIHEHTNINFVTWEKTTFPDVSVLWYFLFACLAVCWFSSWHWHPQWNLHLPCLPHPHPYPTCIQLHSWQCVVVDGVSLGCVGCFSGFAPTSFSFA